MRKLIEENNKPTSAFWLSNSNEDLIDSNTSINFEINCFERKAYVL